MQGSRGEQRRDAECEPHRRPQLARVSGAGARCPESRQDGQREVRHEHPSRRAAKCRVERDHPVEGGLQVRPIVQGEQHAGERERRPDGCTGFAAPAPCHDAEEQRKHADVTSDSLQLTSEPDSLWTSPSALTF